MVRTGLTDQAVGMAATVTVNDVLDGHVGLDVECLDRIYLNGYVPNLQVGGQVVSFMTQHLGCPIPSPAIMEKIGTGFRKAVASFAEADYIPVVRRYGLRPQGKPGTLTKIGAQRDIERAKVIAAHTDLSASYRRT